MTERIDGLEARLEAEPASIQFSELRKVCEHFFGKPRHRGGSHLIFKTGLREPALVNIQPQGKMAKPYQCRQVAAAVRAFKRRGV